MSSTKQDLSFDFKLCLVELKKQQLRIQNSTIYQLRNSKMKIISKKDLVSLVLFLVECLMWLVAALGIYAAVYNMDRSDFLEGGYPPPPIDWHVVMLSLSVSAGAAVMILIKRLITRLIARSEQNDRQRAKRRGFRPLQKV